MNKYGAQKTFSQLCDRSFDSKGEARRGEELRLLEMAGEISDLCYQISFLLSTCPKISLTVDFSYQSKGQTVYEDFKGVLTRDSRTKIAWTKQMYGIQVQIVR